MPFIFDLLAQVSLNTIYVILSHGPLIWKKDYNLSEEYMISKKQNLKFSLDVKAFLV